MATTAARGRAAKKKRAPKKKTEQESPKLLGTGQMQNEAGAVVLGCVGLLTLLALASYHPGDVSLNAGGGQVVPIGLLGFDTYKIFADVSLTL